MATDNKYDRQLRLWGPHGQKALMESNILLLGCHPSGVETLKNLVLPGFGFITIVDDRLVEERDLGNNFFVDLSSLGKPIASVVTEFLLEMNPDVKGESIVQSPEEFIKSQNELTIRKFNFILTSELPQRLNLQLSELALKADIKSAYLTTCGLIASLRLCGNNHTILEAKPEKIIDDLRLGGPFKELQAFADKFDLESLDDMTHKHVPFIVLLIKFIKIWADKNENMNPNYEEKKRFKELIMKKSRCYGMEENFQQAVEHSFKCFSKLDQLPDEIGKIFGSDFCKNASKTSDKFWILCKALQSFYQEQKCLPLLGSLPDMTSLTDFYLELKAIYKEKAKDDLVLMRKHILSTFGEDLTGVITDEDLKLFCENVLTLEWSHFRSLKEEITSPNPLDYFENDCYKWYFALRAREIFKEKHGREPGIESPADSEEMLKFANELKFPNILPIEKEILDEMYEGCHVHTIAALLGGLASQEIIKLITRQFVPLNNTFIFNGISSEAAVFEF